MEEEPMSLSDRRKSSSLSPPNKRFLKLEKNKPMNNFRAPILMQQQL
jgi:hypothetical protein